MEFRFHDRLVLGKVTVKIVKVAKILNENKIFDIQLEINATVKDLFDNIAKAYGAQNQKALKFWHPSILLTACRSMVDSE